MDVVTNWQMLAQHLVAAFLRETIFLLVIQDVDNKGVTDTPRLLFTFGGISDEPVFEF
jgi:hypothetical protein